MNNLQNDYTAAKGWATSHLVMAMAISAAVFFILGMIVG